MWALIQYDWCHIRRKHRDTERRMPHEDKDTQAQMEDSHVKTGTEISVILPQAANAWGHQMLEWTRKGPSLEAME